MLILAKLGLPCLILPWMIRAVPPRSKTVSVQIVRNVHTASRGAALSSNPLLWLNARQNHPLFLLYLCVALRFVIGFVTTIPFEAEVAYIVLLAVLPKIFVVWHASGMMAEERRSGFLESLLTTPMSASEILKGKTAAIRRQIYPALLFALAVQWAISMEWWAVERQIPIRTTVVLAVMATLLIDVHTVAWIGLWQGLLARDRRRALIRSFFWGVIAPWGPAFAFFGGALFLFDPKWLSSPLNTLAPALISANVVSFGLACFAMARLHDNFRSTATQNWSGKAMA